MINSGKPVRLFLLFFLIVYVFIYINSNQFIFSSLLDKLWSAVVPVFAGMIDPTAEISTEMTGSGDGLYNWYSILLFLLISLVAAILLSVFRSKVNVDFLKKGFYICLRYFLAFQMITYGVAKLFSMQFVAPPFLWLDQSLGDISPMRMLWSFMGSSKPYVIFTGILELVPGILLLNRRTTTLGALATFGVMANVMMMNYCYDVPVKLLSTHMVLFALILIAADARRLFSFFIKGASTPALITEDIVPEKWRKIKDILKWVLLTGGIGYGFYSMNKMNKEYAQEDESIIIEGAYKVSEFNTYDMGVRNEITQDSVEWKKIYPLSHGWTKIKCKNEKDKWYKMSMDSVTQTMHFTTRKDSIGYKLNYNIPSDSTLVINGSFKEDSIVVKMDKVYRTDYPLVSRGFHWVSEYPHNR